MAKEESSPTVSFRLPEPYHGKLAQLADAAGVTIHQFARTLVVSSLEHDAAGELQTALEDVQSELEGLRLCVAKSTEAVLLNVTQLPREEVRRWVFERLFGKGES